MIIHYSMDIDNYGDGYSSEDLCWMYWGYSWSSFESDRWTRSIAKAGVFPTVYLLSTHSCLPEWTYDIHSMYWIHKNVNERTFSIFIRWLVSKWISIDITTYDTKRTSWSKWEFVMLYFGSCNLYTCISYAVWVINVYKVHVHNPVHLYCT